MGLQVVDVERVKPWAVVRAVLGNAAVVLGISTCIESLYRVWRELKFRGRVLDWSPSSPEPDLPIARVAHLSDPHFVGERYGYRMEAGTHGPRGNCCIRAALDELAAIHASNPVDHVLLTGDITDAGTRAEWAEFADVHVIDRATGTIGPSLRDYLRRDDRVERLRELAASGTVRGRREMTKVWDSIFPLVELPTNAARYGVILLNSNARSHFALTNAIGVVNPSQLKALNSILRGSAHMAWLILLHHQVVEYPVPSISLTDRIGLALVNAPDVLDAIGRHASRCLVLHGHRHRDWIGTCGGLVLCSAPSVTLGGSFFIHELAAGDARVRLTATERVKVS